MEDGRLDESHDLPLTGTGVAGLPRKAAVVLLGLSSTLVTVLFFVVLGNVWLTFAGVATVWVVVPLGWCHRSTAVKRIVLTAGRRGLRRPRWQLALSVPAVMLIIASALVIYRAAARVFVDVDQVRQRLAEYGLTAEMPVPDAGMMTWLTFLNPFMEEFFWRLFVFQLLRQPQRSWWAPAACTEMMYAAYHLPVVLRFLAWSQALLAGAGLVAFGILLQLIVERVGLILAVAVHMAGDFVVSLLVADIIWSWGIAQSR
jgi:hypothetical protein